MPTEQRQRALGAFGIDYGGTEVALEQAVREIGRDADVVTATFGHALPRLDAAAG